MRFARLSQLAAALVLLTVGVAAPAYAQQNKPIRSGNWYEDRANDSIGSSQLTLKFAQTPIDKFLNVTHVDCRIATLSNQVITNVYLSGGTTFGSDDLNRPHYLIGDLNTQATVGGSTISGLTTNAVYMKYGPGRYPSVVIWTDLFTSGNGNIVNASCSIVGDLSDN